MILTTNGFLMCEPYGRGVHIPRGVITGAYTFMAVLVPVVIPVWFAPILYRLLPEWVRYG